MMRTWMKSDLNRIPLPLGINGVEFRPGRQYRACKESGLYGEQYTRAAMSSMIDARLDFANQYDTQSVAGYGSWICLDAANKRPYRSHSSHVMKEMIAK